MTRQRLGFFPRVRKDHLVLAQVNCHERAVMETQADYTNMLGFNCIAIAHSNAHQFEFCGRKSLKLP